MIQDFLKNLRVNCSERNIPIISQETQDILYDFLTKHKPKIILEIWSAVGYSTIFIANTVKKRDGKVFSFEISYSSYIEWLNNIKQSWTNNIVLYPLDINKIDLNSIVHHKIDFAFIDWQKNQYADYLMKVQNMISSDGVIVLDDVIKYHNKLSWLYWYLQENQIYYDVIKTEPGDWVLVIKS